MFGERTNVRTGTIKLFIQNYIFLFLNTIEFFEFNVYNEKL